MLANNRIRRLGDSAHSQGVDARGCVACPAEMTAHLMTGTAESYSHAAVTGRAMFSSSLGSVMMTWSGSMVFGPFMPVGS